jgi:hypothetical protein
MFSKKSDYIVYSDSTIKWKNDKPEMVGVAAAVVDPTYNPNITSKKNIEEKSLFIVSNVYTPKNPPIVSGHKLNNVGASVIEALAALQGLNLLYDVCQDNPYKVTVELRSDFDEVAMLMRKKAYKLLDNWNDNDTRLVRENLLWYKDQFRDVQGNLIKGKDNIANNACSAAIARAIEEIKGRHPRDGKPMTNRMRRRVGMHWPDEFGEVYDSLLERNDRSTRSESAQKMRELYLNC